MAGKKQSLTPEEKLARALVPQDQQPYKLPKGWVWTRLGNIAVWGSGGTPSRKHPEFYNGNIPWVKTGELNDSYIIDTTEKITKTAISHSSAKIYPKDTVIIAMYGATIGKTGILGVEATTNQACACAQTLPCVYFKYLFYFLISQKFYFIERGKGGAQPNISQDILKKCFFPLPPLPEQKRIVARIESLFAKLDAARDKLQQVLDTQEARRAAILHKAFTGRLTGDKGSAEYRGKKEEGSSQHPEGTAFVPEGWKNIDLKDCIQLLSGQDFPRNKYNDENEGIPYITGASNFLSNHVIINRWTSTPTVIAKENDILLVCKGSGYGKVCIADFQEAHIARQIMALRPKDFINNRFLYYYLQNMYKTLRNQGQGLIPGISRKVVLNLNITLPPLDEQQKIVQFLDRFDRQNDKVNTLIQQSLSQIDLLKKSILARAFRGQLGTQDPSDPDARDLLTGD